MNNETEHLSHITDQLAGVDELSPEAELALYNDLLEQLNTELNKPTEERPE